MRYELVFEEIERMKAEPECQDDLRLLIEWSHGQAVPGRWHTGDEPDSVRQARERLHYRKQLAYYRAGMRFRAALDQWQQRAASLALLEGLGADPQARQAFGRTALAYPHDPIVCDGTLRPIWMIEDDR